MDSLVLSHTRPPLELMIPTLMQVFLALSWLQGYCFKMCSQYIVVTFDFLEIFIVHVAYNHQFKWLFASFLSDF